MIFFLIVWLLCGFYGMMANKERVPRVFKIDPSLPDGQHFITFILGPVGIMLVMLNGGRWLFWEKP